MGLFAKKIGPVFLKETSDTAAFIEKMQELKKNAPEMEKEIERQIKLARYGAAGENNIAFELKNSGMDMYILHDIYLETETLSAQIDYIVVTRQCTFIIECKNLIGNITIDNTGSFIRTYELGNKWIKEGIYSPVTQNQRHMQVIKEIRKKSKSNFITKMMFEKYFNDNYKPVVVLANPKTVLNAKYAKKEIKDQVIRADQLIAFIRDTNAHADVRMNDEEMLELASFFLSSNKPERSDYAKKYEEMVALSVVQENSEETEEININVLEKQTPVQEPVKPQMPSVKEIKTEEPETQEKMTEKENIMEAQREELVSRLKAFRLEQSRKEGIKAYYIFNDLQMQDLISQMPENKEELLKVSGFGTVKVEKYGEVILGILKEVTKE